MCIQNEAETQGVMYMNNHTVSPNEHKFSPSDFGAYAFSVHLFFFLSFPLKGRGLLKFFHF